MDLTNIETVIVVIARHLWILAVLALLVLLQQFPGPKGDATHVAGLLLRVFLVHVQLMDLEASLVGVGLAALVAEVVQPQLGVFLRDAALAQVDLLVGQEGRLETERASTL